jgi:hypothetical protein
VAIFQKLLGEEFMKRYLRWIALISCLAVTVPVFSACTHPATIQTQAGVNAFTANEILKRVERLQNAAIAAQKNGSLPLDQARGVVFVTVNLAQIADAATQGWQAALKQAWVQGKADFAVLRPGGQLAVVAATIDELLGCA